MKPGDGALHLLWTKQAAAYGVLGVLLLVGVSLLGSTHLVVAGGILLLWLGLDAVWAATGHPQVDLRIEPQRVPEEGTSRITLHASHILPNHQLMVPLGNGLEIEDGGSNLWSPGRKGRKAEHEIRVTARVRGPQAVGPVHVRRWSPSRLWISDVVAGTEQEIDVVPRREPIDAVRLRNLTLRPMQGRFGYNQPGQGMEFFALREYSQGDTMRDVNWKASARSDELFVNQRQRETETEIVLMVDARVVSGVGPLGQAPLDRSCRVARVLFEEASNARDPVRFAAYGPGVKTMGRSAGGRVHAFEELLAKLPAEGEMPLQGAWEELKRDVKGAGPAIILSSCEADPTMADVVRQLAGRGHPVTVISPTPTGPRFEDPAASWRRAKREQAMEDLRQLGAVVVDWELGSQLMADAPDPRGPLG